MGIGKISNIDINSRPREKSLREGISKLSDKELLAIIIRCGIKGVSAIDMGELILEKYGSLSNLLTTDLYSLMQIKGIKMAKAVELLAVIELAKRVSQERNRKVKKFKSALDIYEFVKIELENEKQEHFVVLFLNTKLDLIKKETLFIGGEVFSLVDVNLIFKKAISCGARRFICIHNHPSGDPTPSKEDVILTNKIREISKIIDIELIDHLIIGKDDFFSFKQMEL